MKKIKQLWKNIKFLMLTDMGDLNEGYEDSHHCEKTAIKKLQEMTEDINDAIINLSTFQVKTTNGLSKDIKELKKLQDEFKHRMDVYFSALDGKVDDMAKRVQYRKRTLTKNELIALKYK